MPKANQFLLTGTVTEISEPQFLQNGAEVQTIVLGWKDGEYPQSAAVDFYAKNGLEKLHKKEIALGDTISVPIQPSSKVKEGTGRNGAYRFFQTTLRGDSWSVDVVERGPGNAAAEAKEIPLDGQTYVPPTSDDDIPF